MFSRIIGYTSIALVFSMQVHGHAAVTPALGVAGTPIRSDVQRPSTAKPCGTINIASALDTSTPVTAAADGTFSAIAADFNAGADGSLSFAATVDPTATGKKFVSAKVTQNGDANPTSVSSQQLTVSLPAGTKCSGGTAGNLCLVSFKSTAGFGNCVVVQQATADSSTVDASASGASAASGSTAATDASGSGPASSKATPKVCPSGHKCHKKLNAAGTRAARAILAEIRTNEYHDHN